MTRENRIIANTFPLICICISYVQSKIVMSAVLERQQKPLLCGRADSQLKYFLCHKQHSKPVEVDGGDYRKHGDLRYKIHNFHHCLTTLQRMQFLLLSKWTCPLSLLWISNFVINFRNKFTHEIVCRNLSTNIKSRYWTQRLETLVVGICMIFSPMTGDLISNFSSYCEFSSIFSLYLSS